MVIDNRADGALAQCCMCGKTDLSTAEDGGPECELHDGRWVCSSECWDIAASIIDRRIPRPAEPAPADVSAQLAELDFCARLHPQAGYPENGRIFAAAAATIRRLIAAAQEDKP